jgi:hypothetical protein
MDSRGETNCHHPNVQPTNKTDQIKADCLSRSNPHWDARITERSLRQVAAKADPSRAAPLADLKPVIGGCAASRSGPTGPKNTALGAQRSGAVSHPAKSRPAQHSAPPVPTGAVTVVRGRQVIEGVELRFPRTIAGAISAAAAAETEVITLDPRYDCQRPPASPG